MCGGWLRGGFVRVRPLWVEYNPLCLSSGFTCQILGRDMIMRNIFGGGVLPGTTQPIRKVRPPLHGMARESVGNNRCALSRLEYNCEHILQCLLGLGNEWSHCDCLSSLFPPAHVRACALGVCSCCRCRLHHILLQVFFSWLVCMVIL